VNLRLIIISLLTVVFQSLCQAADTNLTADADARLINEATGLRTKLVATGGWSKPVTGAHGNRISGRLLVYDGAYFTNELGKPGWFAAPVFVEITNEMGFPTQIFFNWEKDVRFELRDVNGKPADNLKLSGGVFSWTPRDSNWASVPADGLLRLRANRNVSTQYLGTERPNPGGLSLFFRLGEEWLIPAGDTNDYFLSATFMPQPTNYVVFLAGHGSQPTNSVPGSNAVWQATLEFPAVKLGSSVLK
jgi:hypothetical protein